MIKQTFLSSNDKLHPKFIFVSLQIKKTISSIFFSLILYYYLIIIYLVYIVDLRNVE